MKGHKRAERHDLAQDAPTLTEIPESPAPPNVTARKGRLTMPQRFEPRFWKDADRRCAIVREIKGRVQRLMADSGADSYQKEILCQRAVFVAIQLETQERVATEKGEFDAGVYTQGTNCLVGLLKALGLEKKAAAIGLRAYVKGRAG